MPGIRAPLKPETTPLPSLDPPGDEYAHLGLAGGGGPFCGGAPHKHKYPTRPEEFHLPCPVCGAPRCPACLDLARARRRSGITP